MNMPNRIIKESICYSDDIDRLSWFEEVVFYRLLVRCDDNGRLDARPSFLRSMLFATKQGVTDSSISDAVDKLASIGLVILYETGGKPFLFFPKWSVHQRVRNVRGKYPPPPDGFLPRSAARAESQPQTRPQAQAGASTKEGSVPRYPAVDEVSAYCAERRNSVDPAHFVDFYAARGWRIGNQPMRDWRAAVRTWEHREQEQGKAGKGPDGEADRRVREDVERIRAFLTQQKTS